MAEKKQTIHLYCLCWNEARLLKYFFQHYDEFVDDYFVFDFGSTDGSLDLLREHPKVSLSQVDFVGESFLEEERRLSDAVWQSSKSVADWVILVDIDEHLFRPDLTSYLAECTEQGITALRAVGYQMVSDSFPGADVPLTEQVTAGVRDETFDKLCIFNPTEMIDTNFFYGRYDATPYGKIIWPALPEILLLHYRQMGIDYVIKRSAELAEAVRPHDRELGHVDHITLPPEQIARIWADFRSAAVSVPGIGTRRHVPPKDYDDYALIRSSGLFESEWYLEAYVDIAEAGIDPFVHFCRYGWKEGRRPNRYFDPVRYLETSPDLLKEGINPLADYIRRGEMSGADPSTLFQTEWYRQHNNLSLLESPLRHFLTERRKGLVSPVSYFDAKEYCRHHPEVLRDEIDPFEHLAKAQTLE